MDTPTRTTIELTDIEPLQKQTDQASEETALSFAELKNRYEATLLALSELNSQYAALVEESTYNETLPSQLAAAEKAISELHLREEKLAHQNSELKKQLHQQNKTHKEQLAALEAAVATLQPENTHLRAELQRVQGEIGGLTQLVQQKDALLHDTISSLSFRIGKKITSTAKALPGLPKA